MTAFGGKVRSDRRCGKEFPLQDGSPSECDSTSENPCCSKWGFCGPDAEHCSCTGCVDYRSQEQRGYILINSLKSIWYILFLLHLLLHSQGHLFAHLLNHER